MAHTAARTLVALLLGAAAARGYDAALDPQELIDAIRIGQSSTASTRAGFHRPYRLSVARAPIDFIDIVTPFRRVELAAEERARLGDRSFGQRDAAAVAGEHGTGLVVFVELTFHPLNTYVGVPPYVVRMARLVPPGDVAALDVQRVPRFGVRVGEMPLPYPRAPMLPAGSQPMLGGTVIARFAGAQLDAQGGYDVVVEESGKELARVRVNLANLR